MKNTRFTKNISINHQNLNVHFLMGSGNYRESYKIFSYEGQFEIYMKNWVDRDGSIFQFADDTQIPKHLQRYKKKLHSELNKMILETWD